MLKLGGENLGRNILVELRTISSKIFINCKGKYITLRVERTDGNPLNQVIKVKVTSNKTYQQPKSCDVMPSGGHKIISAMFLSKMHNLRLIMKKYQTNPN